MIPKVDPVNFSRPTASPLRLADRVLLACQQLCLQLDRRSPAFIDATDVSRVAAEWSTGDADRAAIEFAIAEWLDTDEDY